MAFLIVNNGNNITCDSIDSLKKRLLKEAEKCTVLDYHVSVRYRAASGMLKNQFISIGKDKKIKYTYKENEIIDFSKWEDELTSKA
jgi:hypothetical protein